MSNKYLNKTFTLPLSFQYQPNKNGKVDRNHIRFGKARTYEFWCKCYPELKNLESYLLLEELERLENNPFSFSDENMITPKFIKEGNFSEELEMRLLLWLCV